MRGRRACSRARAQPVAIGRLERYLGDYDLACDLEDRCRAGGRARRAGSAPPSSARGRRRLACAGELARLGHSVTIFESLHAPGGVLVYGIPEFRLPKRHRRRRDRDAPRPRRRDRDRHRGRRHLHRSRPHGGRKASTRSSSAAGAGLPIFLGHPRREPQRRVLGERVPHAREPHARLRVPGKVGHAGRGAAARSRSSAAATSRWTRRAPPCGSAPRRSSLSTAAPRRRCRRARKRSTTRARRASSSRCSARQPEIVGRDGFVTGMVATRMELAEPDESGRRAPVCVLGADFVIECDTVIVALGTRANPILAKAAPGIELRPPRLRRRRRRRRHRPAGRLRRAATSSPARRPSSVRWAPASAPPRAIDAWLGSRR